MNTSPGSRLGPYEIIAPAGAGGMGEVYRARDTRLGRDVAIKVLPLHLSSNPSLRERFDREARAISNLTHAHICTLYDVGAQDGIDYLVMEFLEGETLADRIGRGPLSVKDVIRYGAEIAEALDKAHRQGIVHRDLKPGNVMITKAGAKVLDFGLATYATRDSGPGTRDQSALETAHKPITAEGTILGTVQYMAPEQLEGRDADARTDIFALGAILYEMATGKRAFEGKSRASLIASIMSATPQPISAINPITPPALERIVRTCLEKDPDDRWQSARDVARELKWISETSETVAARAPARRRVIPIIAAAALAAGALGWFAARATGPRSRPEVVRFTIEPPDGFFMRAASLSPDGRRIAYLLVEDDRRTASLWVRSLADSQARRVVDGGSFNLGFLGFWSPDSTRFAYFVLGTLQSVHVDTGAVHTICETGGSSGVAFGSWGRKGTILFEGRGSIFRVSERGGEPTVVLTPGPQDVSYAYPSFLPDGDRFLFFRRTEEGTGQGVYVGSLDGSPPRLLIEEPGTIQAVSHFAPPGYLLHRRGDKILAWKFDARRERVTGDPVVLADGVDQAQRTQFSIAESGALLYRGLSAPSVEQIVVIDRSGKETETIGPTGAIWHLALSPDERFLALEMYDAKVATTDLWLVNLETQVPARLTFDQSFEWQVAWSPDGSQLYFASNRAGDQSDIFSMAPAGGGAEPKAVYRGKYMQAPMDLTADGSYLLVHDTSANQSIDVVAVPPAGGDPVPVARSSFDERCARFSPDGRWVAYDSNESGDRQVFVQSFPDARRKIRISTAGGQSPSWRSDGRELYYLTPDGELMLVEMRRERDELRPGRPSLLFRLDRSVANPSLSRYVYAPARDGSRFFVRKQLSAPVEAPLHVVLNATSLLE